MRPTSTATPLLTTSPGLDHPRMDLLPWLCWRRPSNDERPSAPRRPRLAPGQPLDARRVLAALREAQGAPGLLEARAVSLLLAWAGQGSPEAGWVLRGLEGHALPRGLVGPVEEARERFAVRVLRVVSEDAAAR